MNFTTIEKEIILSETVQKGMELLKNQSNNQNSEKLAAKLFQQVADDGDLEACWRIAACFCKGIGVDRNNQLGSFYAEKAMNEGLVDGIFWYGISCESYEKAFPYLKESYEKGHLAGKFFVGWFESTGHGTTQNVEEGKKKIEEVGMSEDSYWTNVFSLILEKGMFGFNADKVRSNQLKTLSSKQPISDCSIFKPWF